jgi:hypothetical protein
MTDKKFVFVVYAPFLVSCLWIYMAFQINDHEEFFPWKRSLTAIEETLERRGLLGDASVGILVHLMIFLSSETKVRVAANFFYVLYKLQLWYHGPLALLRMQDTDLFQRDIVQRNANIVLLLAVVNSLGALLLYVDGRGHEKQKKH